MRAKKKLLAALAAVFALGVLVTGGILLWRSVSLRRAEAKAQEALAAVQAEVSEPAAQAQTDVPEAPEQPQTAPEAAQEAPEAAQTAPETPEAPQAAPETAAQENPDDLDGDGLLDRYQSLTEQYPDFAGWLTIGADDVINTLVVRGTDNEFYLDHDFTGQAAWGGAIFMDCGNALEPLSRNTILYGHHLADQFADRMFGALLDYKDPDYALKNQCFTFSTPYRDYTCTVFASYSIYPSDWRLYSLEFTDDQDFLDYCADAVALSQVDYGVTVEPGDHILTLSTCDYVAQDTRFIVHALIEPQ